MKRTVFILTAFLAVMSCTVSQDLDVPEAAQDAVGFDVYTHGALETKAGYPGEINLDALKVTGFGVYGYISSKPDFMANQHVTYSGGWVYSPVKYWPNQDGVNIDFYAYAPYVEQSDFATLAAAQADAALAEPTKEGIVYIHPNNVATTPKIVYRTPKDPSNSVDLMFGVAAEAHTSPSVTVGLPFLDMTKLKLGEKMKFNFKHALTKLVVNVDGYFDEVNGGTPGNNNVDPNTRVVIKSVNIKTTQLAVGGTLDLNNTVANTPNWTVGTTLSAFNASAGYDLPIASYLKYIEDNTESVTHFSQQPLGVTKTTQSLMGYGIDGTTAASLLFVPAGDAADLTITITYEVITRDPNLGKGYSITENPVTSTIAAANLGANAFKPGYATTLNLHLGLASVKFDATITNWETGETENVDLPENEKIPGYFSVSPTKQVVFSPGNLQYQRSTDIWRFAEHQWNYVAGASDGNVYENAVKSDNRNIADPDYTGWIDLFGWGTSGYNGKLPTLTSSTNTDYGDGENDIAGTHYDWGVHQAFGTDPAGSWRTLTSAEWSYLFSDRATGHTVNSVDNARYTLASINTGGTDLVYGMILFPDNFRGPYDSNADITFRAINTDAGDTGNMTACTSDGWNALEDAGCMFLPFTTLRFNYNTLVNFDYGYYWSSSHGDDYPTTEAFCLQIGCNLYGDNGFRIYNEERKSGLSVRLVKDCN